MAAVDSLKVFGIAGRTNSSGTAQVDVDQEELRLVPAAVMTAGRLPHLTTLAGNPDAFKVRQDTGSNMQIKVGSGTVGGKVDGYLLRGTTAGQGAYLVRLDSATVTLTVPAADGTNPAKYGVYLYVNDENYGGGAGIRYAGLSCIRGTPAGSPTVPGPLSAWSAYALLWSFQLAASATAVTNTILDNTNAADARTTSVLIGTDPYAIAVCL